MPVTHLEGELNELDEAIRQADADTERLTSDAESVVEDYRENGVNPLTDPDAFDSVDEAYRLADDRREEASQLRQRRERMMEHLGRRSSERNGGRSGAVGWAAAAESMMGTPEYERLAQSGAFDSQQARIELPPVEVLSRDNVIALFQNRAVRHATADVDDMVDPDQRLFPPVPIPVRPVRVLDLITMATTDSDQVDYVEETTRTDVAAETAPGTAAPEATYVYTNRTAPVRDIPQFTPAHKRNLSDRGQIQSLLEGRLRAGVERRFESQVVSGDGLGENLTGILETTGIGSVLRDTAGGERRLEAIHRGITAVRLSLFAEPDAIGIHPTSYQDVIFEKDDQGAYLLGPASQQTSRTIWGFPAAISPAFPSGTGLVGNFSEGAVAWVRAGVSVSASDSHANFFTERRVALLAEMRAAFAAWQPRAFAEVTDL